jgi:hypothetical protein
MRPITPSSTNRYLIAGPGPRKFWEAIDCKTLIVEWNQSPASCNGPVGIRSGAIPNRRAPLLERNNSEDPLSKTWWHSFGDNSSIESSVDGESRMEEPIIVNITRR